MAVLTVSSVRFNNSTAVNFGRRENKESENKENNYNSQKASGMVTVPAALLLALATSAINAKEPMPYQDNDNTLKTELLAYATPESQQYSSSQRAISPNAAHDKYLRYHSNNIVYSEKVARRGTPHTMVFEHVQGSINSVRMVPYDFVDKVEYTNYKGQREVKSLNPPQVVKLVYHDTGKDSEFCGVVVRENHYTSKGEFYNLDKEIMLTDNAANQIIDLLAGDSKWSNKTSIEYSTTTSPNLLPPKRF